MDTEEFENDFVLSGTDSIIDTSLSTIDSSTSKPYIRKKII